MKNKVMIIQGNSNGKKVILEYIIGGDNILNSKKFKLYNTYKDENLGKVFYSLHIGDLNCYINVEVFNKGILEFSFVELYKSNTIEELFEILLIMFIDLECYEICSVLKNHLNKEAKALEHI